MATQVYAGGAPAARAGIDWILNPNIDFTETDTNAAEQAVAGGLAGSQFAGFNNLRLRDSERMNRIELGNKLLNPFLEREQQASLAAQGEAGQNNRLQLQIGAQAAQQALEQAGLDRRLGATTAAQMQLALLNGDINAQHQLLEEAGADRRQAATIAGDLRRTQITAQNQLLSTLIGAGGGGGRGGGGVTGAGVNNVSTGAAGGTYAQAGSGSNVFGAPMSYNPAARPGANPTAAGTGGGSSTNRYNQYITKILQGYGLS